MRLVNQMCVCVDKGVLTGVSLGGSILNDREIVVTTGSSISHRIFLDIARFCFVTMTRQTCKKRSEKKCDVRRESASKMPVSHGG